MDAPVSTEYVSGEIQNSWLLSGVASNAKRAEMIVRARIVTDLCKLSLKLARAALLSSILSVIWVTAVSAHEVRPSVSDVLVGQDSVEIDLTVTAEALLSGIDLSSVQDTNDAPESEQYDALRALSEAELTEQFRAAWDEIAAEIDVMAGDVRIPLELGSVEVEAIADLELPRSTKLQLRGALPAGDTAVTLGWAAEFGPLVVRQMNGGDDAYTGYLERGVASKALPRGATLTEGSGAVFLRYIVIGFEHIIPKGLDHILFVLGLFFFSLKMRPLLMQITAFTLAHTVTLALASLGYVTIAPEIVEPLIAISIVYVAVENIIRPKLGWWRTAVVFGFGLLHGLGFASVLGDVGLEPGRFVVGLIAFNIGVEIGQLTVIAIAFQLVGYWFGKKVWYRAGIAVPASVIIACVGAWWAYERVVLG
jgi:hypothetical protein